MDRNLDWGEVEPRGTIYSFTVDRRGTAPAFVTQAPYVIAIVELDAGPHLTTNIVGCEVDDVRVDMRVEGVFEDVTEAGRGRPLYLSLEPRTSRIFSLESFMAQAIHADSHISEPATLWADRVSQKKWGDLVPHVQFDPEISEDRWFMGGKKFQPTAGAAMAGWKDPPPKHPPTLDDADHGSWEANERLRRMDEYGIWAQVIYPNAGGFGSGNFLSLKEPELMLDCVRAYNDFLIDWTSVDKERFLPIMAMPFWDVQECVKEIERSAKNGHRGILMTNQPHVFDFPRITEEHWNPLWKPRRTPRCRSTSTSAAGI